MSEQPGPETHEREALTVLVADDHPLWRDALVADLEQSGITVVGTAADGPSAVARTRATIPSVLVLDLNMPGLRGDEVCAAIADLPTRILILSASGEEPDVLATIKAGASGYLVKSASGDEIRQAVLDTAAGEAVFTPGLAGMVLGEFRDMQAGSSAEPEPAAGEDPRPVPELTERETEILRYVAMGMTAKEIATDLVLSHRTVQNHVQNILGKLHLHNRVELTRFAISRGLDTPD